MDLQTVIEIWSFIATIVCCADYGYIVYKKTKYVCEVSFRRLFGMVLLAFSFAVEIALAKSDMIRPENCLVILMIHTVLAIIFLLWNSTTNYYSDKEEMDATYLLLATYVGSEAVKKFKTMSRSEQITFLKTATMTLDDEPEVTESIDKDGCKVITTVIKTIEVPIVEDQEELKEWEIILRKENQK